MGDDGSLFKTIQDGHDLADARYHAERAYKILEVLPMVGSHAADLLGESAGYHIAMAHHAIERIAARRRGQSDG